MAGEENREAAFSHCSLLLEKIPQQREKIPEEVGENSRVFWGKIFRVKIPEEVIGRRRKAKRLSCPVGH